MQSKEEEVHLVDHFEFIACGKLLKPVVRHDARKENMVLREPAHLFSNLAAATIDVKVGSLA